MIASGAIDSEAKGSDQLSKAFEIPLTKPGINCSSFSIPSWTFFNKVLKGASK